jgi:hypothetical protein
MNMPFANIKIIHQKNDKVTDNTIEFANFLIKRAFDELTSTENKLFIKQI